LINYGVPAEEWRARFRGTGFPIDPWSLDHVVLETSDPAASARWLAGVLGLPVSQVGQGAVGVPLPGCTIAFAPGPANRVTQVVLAGADAPVGRWLACGTCARRREVPMRGVAMVAGY
jgi:catechol 2,3-dioxygenase-like lactoylglutathione lyase family enzyme